jgi:phytoene dehydrogenase-like protein
LSFSPAIPKLRWLKLKLDYDTVCIGSSPLCLLEAMHQARAGRRTLVAEETDKLGGAWRDTSVMGLRGAEVGPHIITFNADTYDFLQKDLGLEMFPLEPLPVYLIKTPLGLLRVPYHFSPFVSYLALPYHFLANAAYRARLSELKEEYFGRLRDAVRLTCRWLFSSQKPRLLYPKGGTAALMRSIMTQLESAGVEVR